MDSQTASNQIQRYIALDIHKEYVMVGAKNAAQDWVIRARRVEMPQFRTWAGNNLRAGDAVVIETTTNVWDIYDIVAPLVTRAVVAHAGAVRQIAEARVKTGAMIRNRLHSLLHRHNLALPEEGLTNKDWWEAQAISPLEKLQVRQELSLLAEIEKHKAELGKELSKMSVGQTWGKQATGLLQLPGIGVTIALTVLAAIGDIRRFEDPKHLVGYAGLGAGVHDSGKEHIDKGITKSGRKELRWALVEAAWKAVQMSPIWKARFEELKKRKGSCKAIVAIARKLLVTIWYVLAREETDRNASEEDLAWKMLLWSWSLAEEARLGLTPKQFAKYSLLRLGVQNDVTSFMRGKVLRRIAPAEEVLARISELGLPRPDA